jgi:hypothetical protein
MALNQTTQQDNLLLMLSRNYPRFDRASGLIETAGGLAFLHPPIDRFLIETPLRAHSECWKSLIF